MPDTTPTPWPPPELLDANGALPPEHFATAMVLARNPGAGLTSSPPGARLFTFDPPLESHLLGGHVTYDKETGRLLSYQPAPVVGGFTRRDEVSTIGPARFDSLLPCGHPMACEGLAGPEGDQPGCGWCADLVDLGMLTDHLSRTYDHFSNGRISKPNTLPEEVFSIANDLEIAEIEEAVREERKLRLGEPGVLAGDLGVIRWWVAKLLGEAPTCTMQFKGGGLMFTLGNPSMVAQARIFAQTLARLCDEVSKPRAAGEPMTPAEHRARHQALHRALDELLADWISHTGRTPSRATVMEFLQWSSGQTENPTEEKVATDA